MPVTGPISGPRVHTPFLAEAVSREPAYSRPRALESGCRAWPGPGGGVWGRGWHVPTFNRPYERGRALRVRPPQCSAVPTGFDPRPRTKRPAALFDLVAICTERPALPRVILGADVPPTSSGWAAVANCSARHAPAKRYYALIRRPPYGVADEGVRPPSPEPARLGRAKWSPSVAHSRGARAHRGTLHGV